MLQLRHRRTLVAVLGEAAARACGGVDELDELADRRLAGTRRELTEAERERYLGG